MAPAARAAASVQSVPLGDGRAPGCVLGASLVERPRSVRDMLMRAYSEQEDAMNLRGPYGIVGVIVAIVVIFLVLRLLGLI